MARNEAVSELPQEKLKKTSAEQTILRNLQELELELAGERDGSRKQELIAQIGELKSHLASVQGPTYFDLEQENEEMKQELKELQDEHKQIKKENTLLKENSGFASLKEELEEEIPKSELKFALYKLLLGKYSGIINDFEKKTVGEIKGLVNSEDLTVQSLLNDFRPENYSFDENYLESAKEVHEYISREINYVKSDLEINFWLSPKEIVTAKLGDDEDQAVFLCSMLFALGDKKAEVVIAELENRSTHAFVITEFKGKFYLLDPTQEAEFEKFSGEKKNVIAKYSFEDSKIKRFLYKFNFENYEQFV
ncbi:MAG: transglutaminase-like domain-containing protein [Candidatus Diapherotrites archaeon]